MWKGERKKRSIGRPRSERRNNLAQREPPRVDQEEARRKIGHNNESDETRLRELRPQDLLNTSQYDVTGMYE